MKIFYYRLKIVILSIILICFFNGQIQSQKSELNFDFDVSYNLWIEKRVLGSRIIYVSLNEKNFNLENLKLLSKFLSDKYSIPKSLTIKVFTNQNRLKQMINYDNPGFSISYTEGEAGKKAQEEYDNKNYPQTTGFYAEYIRYHEDYIIYTQKKDSSNLIRLDLNNGNKKLKKAKSLDNQKNITKQKQEN